MFEYTLEQVEEPIRQFLNFITVFFLLLPRPKNFIHCLFGFLVSCFLYTFVELAEKQLNLLCMATCVFPWCIQTNMHTYLLLSINWFPDQIRSTYSSISFNHPVCFAFLPIEPRLARFVICSTYSFPLPPVFTSQMRPGLRGSNA